MPLALWTRKDTTLAATLLASRLRLATLKETR